MEPTKHSPPYDEAEQSDDPRRLTQLAWSLDTFVLQRVAANPSTPLAALQGLLGSPTGAVVAALLGNPSLDPASVLEHLSKVGRRGFFKIAAQETPHAEVHAWLLADSDPRVRAACAVNPLLSDEQELSLALDGDLVVREELAGRARSHAAQVLVAQDPAVEVRYALAGSTRARPEVLALLVADPDQLIQLALARNLRTPGSTLVELARVSQKETHHALATRYGAPESLLPHLLVECLAAEGLLWQLLQKVEQPHREVATALAQNWQGSLRELLETARNV